MQQITGLLPTWHGEDSARKRTPFCASLRLKEGFFNEVIRRLVVITDCLLRGGNGGRQLSNFHYSISTRPCSMALATACVRVTASSFCRMLPT